MKEIPFPPLPPPLRRKGPKDVSVALLSPLQLGVVLSPRKATSRTNAYINFLLRQLKPLVALPDYKTSVLKLPYEASVLKAPHEASDQEPGTESLSSQSRVTVLKTSHSSPSCQFPRP